MADRYRVFIDLPPSDLSDLDPRDAEPLWDEELFWQDYGLSRASGVCPSFGRILAAPLADGSDDVVGSSGLCGGTEALSNRVGTAERDGAYGACCSATSRVARAAAPESTSRARETKEAA